MKAELMESLGIGSEPESPRSKPSTRAEAAPMDDDDEAEMAQDETPADDAPHAEDDESGEAAASDETLAGDDPDSDEQETDATAQAAADGEPAVDDEALDALARERKWPASYLRRIKKLNARVREVEGAREQEITQLREEVETLRSNPAAAQAMPTDAEQSIQSEIARAERVLDFVDDNPDGGTTPDGASWSREQLRAERRKAERLLRDKEAELQTVKQKRAEAARHVEALLPQRHPALKDRTSEHSRALDALLRNFPVLRNEPALRLMASDAMAFAVLREKVKGSAHGNGATARETVTAAAPPAPRPATRPPGKPRAQAPPTNGARVASRSAEQQFMESGDATAGRQLIESMLGDD